MRRSLIVVSAVLLVFVTAWGSGVLAFPESQGVNQPSIPPEVRENSDKLQEAYRALGTSTLGNPGRPLAGVFAGVYVNESTATIHIGLTRIAEEYTAPIEAMVKQFEGVKVEFFQARFTSEELWEMKGLILRRFHPGSAWYTPWPGEERTPLVWIAVDVQNNGLAIGLREIRPEYVAAIREIVGDEVPILFGEGEVVLHSKTDRHRP